MKFSDLSSDVQNELIKRYGWHDIDAHQAFDAFIEKFEKYNLDPSIFLKLSDEDKLTLIANDFKEISHIKSVKNHPELEHDPNNVIIEDKVLNRRRSRNNMTSEEEEAGLRDFIEDIKDGDINEDGIVDLKSALNEADNHDEILDIIGVALPIGLVMSGIQVVNKLKNKEIVLNDAPKEYVFKVGEHSIKVASVGVLLGSGSPILVGGTSAVLIYKSRKLLEKFSIGIYKAITSDTTKKIATHSGKAVIVTGKYAGKTLFYSANEVFNIATHTITKKSIKYAAAGLAKVSKISTKITSNMVKGSYSVATHDITKKTLKNSGKALLSATKVGAYGVKASAKGVKSLYTKFKKKKWKNREVGEHP